jgi:hypothetical protein
MRPAAVLRVRAGRARQSVRRPEAAGLPVLALAQRWERVLVLA